MHRLYDDLVDLYPLVSAAAQYGREAAMIRRALRRTLGPAPPRRKHSLLELGVGAGHVLSHLTEEFEAAAVDLSPAMLKLSRALNPGVKHHVGDMKTVRLQRKFDAVLIHDAIHYMITEDDLLAALRTAAAHLASGGVALFMPGYVQETYIDGDVSHLLRLAAGDELGYVAQTHDPDPRDSTYVLIFALLTRRRGQMHVEEDRHTCGLFPVATWLRLLDAAGFDARKPKITHGSRGQPPPAQTPMFVAIHR